MTYINPTHTVQEIADITFKTFDALRLDTKNWDLFESLYGQPFDIHSFSLNDYKWVSDSPWWASDGYYQLDIGNDFKFMVFLSKKGISLIEYVTFKLYHCANHEKLTLPLDNNRMFDVTTHRSHSLEYYIHQFWRDFFLDIRRTASITIREHKKYLANPGWYDTIEEKLNIKIRKPK